MDLRCENKLHGIVIEDGVLEVGCDSRFCGAGKGVVVRHRFDMNTGELLHTQRFKQPPVGGERHEDDATRVDAAVRTA
jgi:hypothetical protein